MRRAIKMTSEMELYMESSKGRRDAVDALLAAGADPNHSLSSDEFIFCLQRLWKENSADVRADVDFEAEIALFDALREPRENGGIFPLFAALDKPGVLAVLLAKGADPNARNMPDGATALHHLAWGHIHDGASISAGHLLLAGAEVDSRNYNGETPLILGCNRKVDGGYLELLMARGASVHARDNNGETALHMAAFWDEGYRPWPLDKFREWGEPVPLDFDGPNPVEEKRYPRLSWGALEAVTALVDAGADPNAVNPRNGFTPMHWASVHQGPPYLLFLEALFERGARVDIPNDNGKRPMDFPVAGGNARAAALSRRFAEAVPDGGGGDPR